jgi:hypothetical protein
MIDIRLPIGLLFSLLGLLLAGFGLLSGGEIYAAKSLGVNVNLYWGLALCVFGGLMLWLATRAKSRPAAQPGPTLLTPNKSQRGDTL